MLGLADIRPEYTSRELFLPTTNVYLYFLNAFYAQSMRNLNCALGPLLEAATIMRIWDNLQQPAGEKPNQATNKRMLLEPLWEGVEA